MESIQMSDSDLLEMLQSERSKFTQSDPIAIKGMIDELIRREVYPKETVEGNPNTVYQMVSGWGAYWHIWKGTLECPLCKTDLRNHESGPPGVRTIGVVENDMIACWRCPDCNGTWPRDFNP